MTTTSAPTPPPTAKKPADQHSSAPAPESQLVAQFLKLPFQAQLSEPAPPRVLVRGDFDRIVGSWARQSLTVPVGEEGNSVIIATADPLNVEAIDELRLCYDRPLKVIVTTESELSRVINVIRTNLMSDRSSSLSPGEDESHDEFGGQLKIDVTDAEDDDAPIIRYVNALIFKASSERASDVHIEPYETHFKVRFRVDGVLTDVSTEDRAFHAGVVSRIKVMSGLNIAEKRLPQDGRIGLKIAGRDVDIRVSTVPTAFGERVVMRLLEKSGTVLDLEQIGISPRALNLLIRLIDKPNGIVLVTGPTGSGKTTTLYSCLARINKPDLNILTVEDPIEYQLDGIGQMQVNPKIDFTFASGLRAILRQDPDVVMVGEIRDSETAEIAIQASLTGHLVFSTLHTNDAPGAISRIIDMGIEPFLVSSSLLAVLAQRLVRRLCPDCRVPYEVSDEELRELGLDETTVTKRTVYRRGGGNCQHCKGNGYTGRCAIVEILVINDTVRSLIMQRADASTIRHAALRDGFVPLRLDGAYRVLEGVTSVEEVLMATHEEGG